MLAREPRGSFSRRYGAIDIRYIVAARLCKAIFDAVGADGDRLQRYDVIDIRLGVAARLHKIIFDAISAEVRCNCGAAQGNF